MMNQHLLIVDDQGDLRRMLRIALGYGKYVMHEADNGTDALRIAERVTPDVIVLDVMMPGALNGLDVCRAIKRSPKFDGSYVVLLTALGQDEDIAAGRAAGADAYFVKPFSPAQLIETIEARTASRGDMQVAGPGRPHFH